MQSIVCQRQYTNWYWVLLMLWPLFTVAAAPIDFTVSGFGTLGAAVSDQDVVYQRWIDRSVTLKRDSVIGMQLDAQWQHTLGVTAQMKGAASGHDEGWEPTLSWAFISWRPDNNWLWRLGKLRLPLMHYSANSDVGMTFEFARLPTELYSLIPTTDVTGLAATRTWLRGDNEWVLETYTGRAHSDWRYFLREDLLPELSKGPLYIGVDLDMIGLALSLHRGDNTWHVGVHRGNVESSYGDLPSDYPFVSLAPGIGYYQLDNDVSGGVPVPMVSQLHTVVMTLGMELNLPYNVQLLTEWGRRRITNAIMGPDTTAAYLALKKRIGLWTPYIYWSGIRTRDKVLDLNIAIDRQRVPDFLPGAAMINASQRVTADLMSAYDQSSWAVGTAYHLSPTSQLKAEWLYTRTGRVSSFVDPPYDDDNANKTINVFSLSYSFTF